MLLDVTSWVTAFFRGDELPRRMAAYLVVYSSAILTIVAGTCAILSMNEGMYGILSGMGNVSGSLVFLFLSTLLKFPAVTGLLPREIKLSRVVVGGLGESFIGFYGFISTKSLSAANIGGRSTSSIESEYLIS